MLDPLILKEPMNLVNDLKKKKSQLCIMGLGYVGLPLATEFSKYFPVMGFDIDKNKIKLLRSGIDPTNEIGEAIKDFDIKYTSDSRNLRKASVFIVTVPTPVNEVNVPNLEPLKNACCLIAKNLSVDSLVIVESTVYPGTMDEICIPILETSGLKAGVDFSVGYSPERINPGDKTHTLPNIKKIIAGHDEKSLNTVDELYSLIITAGLFKASSIKVAEAAKIVENVQRDVNIGLMNELSIIFDKLDIRTADVLEAAGTKWNFLNFSPGLVGGHCIGVDPYYLAHKAKEHGYHPDLILNSRNVNDGMGRFIVEKTIDLLIMNKKDIRTSKLLIMGITFKEDVPDIRNTRVVDIVNLFKRYGINIDVHDPWADKEEVKEFYDIDLTNDLANDYDGVIYAVPHKVFAGVNVKNFAKDDGLVIDVRSVLNKKLVEAEGLIYWSL